MTCGATRRSPSAAGRSSLVRRPGVRRHRQPPPRTIGRRHPPVAPVEARIDQHRPGVQRGWSRGVLLGLGERYPVSPTVPSVSPRATRRGAIPRAAQGEPRRLRISDRRQLHGRRAAPCTAVSAAAPTAPSERPPPRRRPIALCARRAPRRPPVRRRETGAARRSTVSSAPTATRTTPGRAGFLST